MNQQQIDVILIEIIPEQNLYTQGHSLGIDTPYRKQTNVGFKRCSLEQELKRIPLTAETYAGRQANLGILLSLPIPDDTAILSIICIVSSFTISLMSTWDDLYFLGEGQWQNLTLFIGRKKKSTEY